MLKKGVSMLLALSICLAAIGVMPSLARYSDTEEITPGLSIAKNTATCSAYVKGKPGTTKITATITLYRIDENGKLIEEKTWDNVSAEGDTLRWSATRAVYSGYTYRLQIDATVYRNGGSETVSAKKDT